MTAVVSRPCMKVLAKLRARKDDGVTWDDFKRGFRLGARIFDLRQAGFAIETIRETIGDCRRARYVLLGESSRSPCGTRLSNLPS